MKTDVRQIVTFKVSILLTLLLSVSVNNYASDIEIYRGPNPSDGKARVILNLDNSTFMTNEPSGNQSKGSIYEDFGGTAFVCGSGNQKYFEETETKVFSNGAAYSYTANYCYILSSKITDPGNNTSAIKRDCTAALLKSGNDTLNIYKCYDRFTRLKRSVLSVINDTNLGEKISIGLSFFPRHDGSKAAADGSRVVVRPLALTAANRKTLSDIVVGVRISQTNAGEKQVPVSKGYGESARALLTQVNTTTQAEEMIQADQCSGYGIYTLTSGLPVDDEMGAARTNTNAILKSTNQIKNSVGQCPDGGSGNSAADGSAWQCIATAAELLMNSKSKLSVPVKSAMVSFGTGFSFTPDLSPYNSKTTTIEQIKQEIAKVYKQSDNNLYMSKQNAAIAGVVGGGGYYAATDSSEVTSSILRFIEEVVKVDIPYLTTGAPTIPQDPLNSAIVQNNAYFPQFKPTPDKNYQLWAGNLKKYKVNDNGQLVDKYNSFIINNLGMLAENYDFWSPAVDPSLALDESEDTPGSLRFALMGGAKSKLALRTMTKADGTVVVNRKLLTNRTAIATGSTYAFTGKNDLKAITLGYLSEAGYGQDPQKGYLMSLLGYQVNDPNNVNEASLRTAPELRQLGAAMHSSPLLITNKGRIDFNAETGAVSTSNREDYVLYGTTQGLIHVVKVGSNASDSEGGKEVFTFAPHEMIEKQSQSFLKFDRTSGGTANLFYGIDAPWTAYTEYVIDGSNNLTVGTGINSVEGKQLIYGGLRMGGRSFYAFDLKNMNDPKLKFYINPEEQKVYFNNSSTTFEPLQYMGQSWSKPKIAWVRWKGVRKLVMFVGGGYDAGYENDSYNQTNKLGAGVYMFDAMNGDLLWWASSNATATSASTTNSGVIALKDDLLKYSVVSEIKTADRNNDGLVDHLYFGDLGGQVFRIDLDNYAATAGAFAKRSVRLLNLNKPSGTSPRFYEAPGFSIYKDSVTGRLFAVISVGSGNRSLPLKTYPNGTAGRDHDAIYNIYDKDVARSDLYSTGSLNSQDAVVTGGIALKTLQEINDQNRFSNTNIVASYSTTAGWYYKFHSSDALQTIKAFNTPAVIDYDMYISSYDSSKPGFTGPCGGGVKGESKVTLFCMPFGQCSAARGLNSVNSTMELGAGIRDFAVGATDGGFTRLITGETAKETGSVIPDQRYGTRTRLIVQRWYER